MRVRPTCLLAAALAAAAVPAARRPAKTVDNSNNWDCTYHDYYKTSGVSDRVRMGVSGGPPAAFVPHSARPAPGKRPPGQHALDTAAVMGVPG